jgi:hypothetical protein
MGTGWEGPSEAGWAEAGGVGFWELVMAQLAILYPPMKVEL